MIGRIAKRIVYGLMVIASSLVAIFLGVVLWNASSQLPPDPEWLLLDARFPVPPGAKVVAEHWIARNDSQESNISSSTLVHFAADKQLIVIKRDLQQLLGAQPSMHWLYCARSRIGEDWILIEYAIQTITKARLNQLAKAYTACVGESLAQQKNKEPRTYVTRAIRIEMTEHVDAKYGSAVIDLSTRACLKDHAEHDPLLQCLARQRSGATIELIRADWAEVFNLVSMLRQEDHAGYL